MRQCGHGAVDLDTMQLVLHDAWPGSQRHACGPANAAAPLCCHSTPAQHASCIASMRSGGAPWPSAIMWTSCSARRTQRWRRPARQSGEVAGLRFAVIAQRSASCAGKAVLHRAGVPHAPASIPHARRLLTCCLPAFPRLQAGGGGAVCAGVRPGARLLVNGVWRRRSAGVSAAAWHTSSGCMSGTRGSGAKHDGNMCHRSVLHVSLHCVHSLLDSIQCGLRRCKGWHSQHMRAGFCLNPSPITTGRRGGSMLHPREALQSAWPVALANYGLMRWVRAPAKSCGPLSGTPGRRAKQVGRLVRPPRVNSAGMLRSQT